MRAFTLSLLLLLPLTASAAVEVMVVVLTDDVPRGAFAAYRTANDPDYFTNFTPTTPNIDAMATAGTRVDHFRSYAICAQTRAAMQGYGAMNRPSNLYGGTKRPDDDVDDYTINPYARNLPRVLKENGWTTNFYGKLHLYHDEAQGGPVKGTFVAAMGWDNAPVVIIGNPTNDIPSGSPPADWDNCHGHNFWPQHDKGGTLTYKRTYATETIMDAAVADIDAAVATGNGKHFFFVSVPAGHGPWQSDDAGDPGAGVICNGNTEYNDDRPPGGTASDDQGVYEEMVEDIDTRMDAVRTAYRAADTYTGIFTADNGIPLAIAITGAGVPDECDRSGHAKGTPYPCGTYVPFIAEGTNIVAAKSMNSQQFHVTDFAPTIVNLAGGTLNPFPDGKSFGDCLTGSNGWSDVNCWTRPSALIPEWTPVGGTTNGQINRMPLVTDDDEEWDRFEVAVNIEIGTAHGLFHRIYNTPDVAGFAGTVSGFMDEFCETYKIIDDADQYDRYTDGDDTARADSCDEDAADGKIVAGDFLTAITDDETLMLAEAQRRLDAIFNNNGAQETTF